MSGGDEDIRIEVVVGLMFRVLAREATPLGEDHLAQDAKNPRAQAGTALELAEPSVDDYEDLLMNVVDLSQSHSHSQRHAPDEGRVLAVDAREVIFGFAGTHATKVTASNQVREPKAAKS